MDKKTETWLSEGQTWLREYGAELFKVVRGIEIRGYVAGKLFTWEPETGIVRWPYGRPKGLLKTLRQLHKTAGVVLSALEQEEKTGAESWPR